MSADDTFPEWEALPTETKVRGLDEAIDYHLGVLLRANLEAERARKDLERLERRRARVLAE